MKKKGMITEIYQLKTLSFNTLKKCHISVYNIRSPTAAMPSHLKQKKVRQAENRAGFEQQFF